MTIFMAHNGFFITFTHNATFWLITSMYNNVFMLLEAYSHY